MTQAQTQNGKTLIRKARMRDAARIGALSKQLGYASSTKQIESRLRSLLHGAGHAVLVAMIPGGEVVGWIHAFSRRLVEGDVHAEIGGLVVDERFRGRGIGALLLRRAEQWAHKRGLNTVYLRTNVIRKDAHAFYERLGYKRIKTQHAYLKGV